MQYSKNSDEDSLPKSVQIDNFNFILSLEEGEPCTRLPLLQCSPAGQPPFCTQMKRMARKLAVADSITEDLLSPKLPEVLPLTLHWLLLQCIPSSSETSEPMLSALGMLTVFSVFVRSQF